MAVAGPLWRRAYVWAFLVSIICLLLHKVGAARCNATTSHLTVDSEAAARMLAETVNCTDGHFEVKWVGSVKVSLVTEVPAGTMVNIIDGGGSAPAIVDGAQANQLFGVSGGVLNLYNLSLDSGKAVEDGGAVYAKNSVVSIRNCTITGNTAGLGDGGALYMEDSVLEVLGSTTFEGNVAAVSGGALRTRRSNVTLFGDIIFVENSGSEYRDPSVLGGATCFSDSNVNVPGKVNFHNNSAHDGGAMWCNSSVFNITGEATFTANKGNFGGAVVNREGNVSFGGSVIFKNNVASSNGGAVAVLDGGKVNFVGEVEFFNNDAESGGGAIAFVGGGMLLLETYAVANFTGNVAGGNGGAIAAWGSVHIINSGTGGMMHFSGNSAGDLGGAIYARSSNELSPCGPSGSCLFVNNSATNNGGGIYAIDVSSLRIERSDFLSNTARIGAGAAIYSSNGYGGSVLIGIIVAYGAKIASCTFSDNFALEDGGGLNLGSGLAELENLVFDQNTAGTSGGALSTSAKMGIVNCTFRMNRAASGPAVTNYGTIDSSENLEFERNTLTCGNGEFIDFTDITRWGDVSERYDSDCLGCTAWASCTYCSVVGDYRVPMCMTTLEHTTSRALSGTLETLSLERGYWRVSDTSKIILKCYREAACAGGSTFKDYCSSGYDGPYCAVCQDDYSPGLDHSCSKCSTAGSVARTAASGFFLAIFTVLLASILSYLASGGPRPSSDSDNSGNSGLNSLRRAVRFHFLKIVVVTWQIITQFSSVTGIVYPSIYGRFLAVVDVSNVDLASILAVGCLYRVDFYVRLSISTLGPLAVLAILACTYTIATLINRGDHGRASTIWKNHVSTALLVIFLVYSHVSYMVFSVFACDNLDDGRSYLRADYSIECHIDRHKRWQGYAAFMILVYPVGIPVVLGLILLAKHNTSLCTLHMTDEDLTFQPFEDLWRPYRPEMYLYEMVAYLRRILLTGIMVFIYPNTAAQIAVALIIEFFFLVVSVFLLPYKERSGCWLSYFGHGIVFMSLYLALLLKVDVSGEGDSSQEGFAIVLVLANCLAIIFVIAEGAFLAWQLRTTADLTSSE